MNKLESVLRPVANWADVVEDAALQRSDLDVDQAKSDQSLNAVAAEAVNAEAAVADTK